MYSIIISYKMTLSHFVHVHM